MMHVLGMAGTAKNTGKTTATSTIMAHAHGQGLKLAVTSIGYDGEAIDNVTGLPKPRLTFRPGMIVATAERCMKALGKRVEVLETTGFGTPLGVVQIGRILDETLVVLAGPNNAHDLKSLLGVLAGLAQDLVIVDGALNRMAPMAVTDGLIICTGAARHQEIGKLVQETHILGSLFELPKIHPELSRLLNEQSTEIMVGDSAVEHRLAGGSLLVRDDSDQLWSQWKLSRWAYVPGVISSACVTRLIELAQRELAGKLLVIEDAVKLAVGQDPLELDSHLDQLQQLGCSVAVRKPLPLIAVTVNPFYPAYRFQTQDYQEAFVDRDKLLQAMRQGWDTPVFNVMIDEGRGLFTTLGSNFRT